MGRFAGFARAFRWLPGVSLADGEVRDPRDTAVAVDDAAWARGRGWALSFATIALSANCSPRAGCMNTGGTEG
ncbi:hypothetical protein [Actinokineospora iranica]|uniref:hypothetical protein n=1 Tax=Actinokineospora iranica TaxID=1271860 RepID=UPI001587C11A|nr:hypothetical protein [Actinokineospora iranica]